MDWDSPSSRRGSGSIGIRRSGRSPAYGGKSDVRCPKSNDHCGNQRRCATPSKVQRHRGCWRSGRCEWLASCTARRGFPRPSPQVPRRTSWKVLPPIEGTRASYAWLTDFAPKRIPPPTLTVRPTCQTTRRYFARDRLTVPLWCGWLQCQAVTDR